jgi:hypothetical protein
MAEYIVYNTMKRNEARAAGDEFGVEFYKLKNNSVSGKCMENVRDHQNLDIVNYENEEKFLLRSSDIKFTGFKVIGDNDFIIMSRRKTEVVLNKPIYCGAMILDISKLHMYKFYYDCLKKKFGDRVSLIYMDTDSYFITVKTADFNKEFTREELEEWFDTGNYPKDHPWAGINKGKIGMFKDEVAGRNIYEFCGLASKMYGYVRDPEPGEGESNVTKIKIKGIPKNVVKKFNIDRLKDVLITGEDSEASTLFRISSKDHKLHTVEEKKLNCRLFDDKRFILEDEVDYDEFKMKCVYSRPLGHYMNRFE